MNFFTINGKPCTDFGVQVSVGGALNSPSRDVTYHQIPGRNGDLVEDNGRYNNLTYTYRCILRGKNSKDFREKFGGFREWIGRCVGYQRIEDTYHPDEFRLGVVSTALAPEMVGSGVVAADFDVTINAKPQRFLKSGENTITVTSGTVLHNYGYASKPLITVYGSGAGTLTVGSYSMTISTIDGYVTLDCEAQDAYKGAVNKNATVSTTFPVLETGNNTITFSGGITSVDIVPRWWRL